MISNPLHNSFITKTSIGLATTAFIISGVKFYKAVHSFTHCVDEYDQVTDCEHSYIQPIISCGNELYNSAIWGAISAVSFYIDMKIFEITKSHSGLNENLALYSPSDDLI